ncbi:MAG TPA: response regulator [Coleofasciculaceae cyanobacterium]
MADVVPKTVLYVEDDAAYVLLLRRALQRSKLDSLPNLRVVTTAEDAIRYLLRQPPYNDLIANPSPALVLTDLRLPGRSGLQLVEWLRGQPEFEGLSIVMLTGSALDEDIEQAYELGVNFCLIKPAEVDSLVSIIQALSLYWVPAPTKATI